MSEADYFRHFLQLMDNLKKKKKLQDGQPLGGQQALPAALQQRLEAIDERLPRELPTEFDMVASLHGLALAVLPHDESEAALITALPAAAILKSVWALNGLVEQALSRRAIESEISHCSSWPARYTWLLRVLLVVLVAGCTQLATGIALELPDNRWGLAATSSGTVLGLVCTFAMAVAADKKRTAALTAQLRKEVEQSLQESVDAALQLEERLQSLGLLRFAARVADIQGSLVAAYVQAQLELIGAQ